jgi:hypothetical protein
MDVDHAGHLAGGGALPEQAVRQHDLLGSQLGRPAEAHATLSGSRPPRPGAHLDQRLLELGDAGKDGEHHSPGRAGRVGPGLAEQAQPGAGLAQPLGDLEQVAGRAGQAVEAVDHDDIALAYLLEQAVQLRPVAPCSRDLLLVDALAAGLFQGGALQREVLVVGADPSIADEHAASSQMPSRKDCFLRPTFATAEAPGSLVCLWCRET